MRQLIPNLHLRKSFQEKSRQAKSVHSMATLSVEMIKVSGVACSLVRRAPFLKFLRRLHTLNIPQILFLEKEKSEIKIN